MPSAANLRFQDYQFQQATPQGYWRWTTRMDVTGPSPTFTIRDIISPFGLLRDSVPLPGAVVQAMAESIGNLQNSFTPSILVSPTALSFTLDEGRGFGPSQCLTVTNTGVFGSLLDVSITSDAPYVRVTPSRMGNLASAETGQIEVAVDSTNLLALNSPYTQTVTFQDPKASNSPVTIPLTINVRPKAEIVVVPTTLTFYAARPLMGPFPSVPAQTFMLSNGGPSTSRLAYTVQKLHGTSPWLIGFTPSTGELAGGSAQLITVAVAPPINCPPGTYYEILRVSAYSTNSYTDVQVTLVIS